jgi:hypothetical protein
MTERSQGWPQGDWDGDQHLACQHGGCAGEMPFVGEQVSKPPAGTPVHADDLAIRTAAWL